MAIFNLSFSVLTVSLVLSFLGSSGIISGLVFAQGCDAYPCQNEGTCVTGTDADGSPYTYCNCKDGSTGVSCEVLMNPDCQLNCLNGGTCMAVGQEHCLCQPSFSGVECEVQSDPDCQLNCLNGGTCVVLASGSACLCLPSFIGEECKDTATYFSFTRPIYAVSENATNLNVTVARTGNRDKTSTVRLETFSDTALRDVNYRMLRTTLLFEPGVMFQPVEIEILYSDQDVNVEFWAEIYDSVEGFVQSPYQSTRILVLDTDSSTVNVFSLQDTVFSRESVGFAEVELLRSGDASQAVTINVTTSGIEAASQTGYIPFYSMPFTFAPFVQFLRIRINTDNNDFPQPDRVFYLSYSLEGQNLILGTVVIVIEDDDTVVINPSFRGQAFVLFAGTLPYRTSEKSGEVNIPIYRVGNMNFTTEIQIETSDGTAVEGADYRPKNTTYRIDPGQSAVEIAVKIELDTVYEPREEYFFITMTVLSGGELGRPQERTVRVNISGDRVLIVSLSTSQYNVTESAGALSVTLLRRERTDRQISDITTVSVRASGDTARPGEDFTPFESEVEFRGDETMKTVNVTILQDIIQEDTEVFHIILESIMNGLLMEPYEAVVTITDADYQAPSTTPPPSEASSIIPIVIGVVVGVLVIFGLVLLILYFYFKRRSAKPEEKASDIPLAASHYKGARDNSYLKRGSAVPAGQGRIAPHSEVDPDTKEYPREKLRFYEEIGSGAFATVYRAEGIGIQRPGLVSTVAVKMLKKTASETDKTDFLKELNVFKVLDQHPNVMSLLGCCTTEEPMYIILDFMSHGNLQSYLQRIRTGKEKEHPGYLDASMRIIQPEEVLLYSSQVARGMEYLASKECIHRDLATRNILLDKDKVCKVSDFGLAREVAEDQQYEMKSKGRVPVRWLAPESLLHNTYTSQSDIWSFGVLMWELVTQGSHPYPGMSSQQVIRQVQHGYRLPKPDCCSQEIYDVMHSCWNDDPEKRPTFKSVRITIEDMLSNAQGYLLMDNFQEDDYLYMTPGQVSDEDDTFSDGKTDAME